MQNFAGALEYLCGWKWATEPGVIQACDVFCFNVCALPMCVDDAGAPISVGNYESGALVFADEREAFSYLVRLTKRDLQYRGLRDDRLATFTWRDKGIDSL